MSIIETARKYRAIIETAMASVDDKTASEGAELFPKLKEGGALIKAGTRINWGGVIKRAAVDLWDTAENNPDNAPALWESLAYRDGWRIIPDTITAAGAFALGEYGWHGDTLYKSLIAANVYTPEQYPNGWEIVENSESEV